MRDEPKIRYSLFLGPLFSIIIFNVIIFVLVARVLIKHSKKSLSRAKDEKEHKKLVIGTLKTLLSVISVMFMFGLTWLFGALSIGAAAIVFQYLFIIFSTFQGFCLFIFFCVIGADAREEWKKLLTCYRYKGPKKSTATPSGVSTGARAKAYNSRETESTRTARFANNNTIRRSVGLLPVPDESSDFDSSVAKLEMSEMTPIKANLIESIIEEDTSLIISNGLAELGHTEPKLQDSQLPPQVLFRLKRPYYDLVEQNGSIPSPDFGSIPSPDFSSTQIEIIDDFDDNDDQNSLISDSDDSEPQLTEL